MGDTVIDEDILKWKMTRFYEWVCSKMKEEKANYNSSEDGDFFSQGRYMAYMNVKGELNKTFDDIIIKDE